MGIRKKLVLKKYLEKVKKENYIHHALGGIYGKYKYIDSVDQMKRLCSRGYKFFEVDINLSSDNVPVLVHRFMKKDYEQRLGMEHYSEENESESDIDWYALSLDELKSIKIHGQFKITTASSLINVLEEYKDVYVLVDIGTMPYKDTSIVFEYLIKEANNKSQVLDRIIVGGRLKEQIEAQMKLYQFPLVHVNYALSRIGQGRQWATIDDFIDYCTAIGALTVTISKADFKPDIAFRLKEKGFIVIVFNTNDEDDGLYIRQIGADLVGTDFLRDYDKEERGLRELKTNLNEKLFAVACGSILGYRDTNSLDAFNYSYLKGFRIIQFDVRLTEEGIPVLVNKWCKKTYKMLRIDNRIEGNYQPPLSYNEFQSLAYYNKLPTATFEELLALIHKSYENADLKFIMSIGRPKASLLQKYMDLICELAPNDDRFIIRLEREKDIVLLRNLGCKRPIIFHYKNENGRSPADINKRILRMIEFCKQYDVEYISMSGDIFNKKRGKLIKSNGIKCCIIRCSDVDEVIHMIDLGADLVGSYMC